jgi:hypothetical protein
MPKPDKVLRFRPLKEVEHVVSKLKRVLLFHPKPIVEELPAKYCVCGKGERKRGTQKYGTVKTSQGRSFTVVFT